jgi:WD40 repeat protein
MNIINRFDELSFIVSKFYGFIFRSTNDIIDSIKIWKIEGKLIESIVNAHVNDVNSVFISADLNNIIRGSADKSIKIWNIEGKLMKLIYSAHHKSVRCVCISADS